MIEFLAHDPWIVAARNLLMIVTTPVIYLALWHLSRRSPAQNPHPTETPEERSK